LFSLKTGLPIAKQFSNWDGSRKESICSRTYDKGRIESWRRNCDRAKNAEVSTNAIGLSPLPKAIHLSRMLSKAAGNYSTNIGEAQPGQAKVHAKMGYSLNSVELLSYRKFRKRIGRNLG
jgi:hypothetical protein